MFTAYKTKIMLQGEMVDLLIWGVDLKMEI